MNQRLKEEVEWAEEINSMEMVDETPIASFNEDVFTYFISIHDAARRSHVASNAYLAIERILDSIDDDITYLFEKKLDDKMRTTLYQLASLSFQIWYIGKPSDIRYELLSILEFDFDSLVSKDPLDGDTLIDLTNPDLIKLYPFFKIIDLPSNNGIIYNNGEEANKNVRENLIYYKECLIRAIRVNFMSEYLSGTNEI